MDTPEQLAQQIVDAANFRDSTSGWRRALYAAIVTSMRSYGAACAAEQREQLKHTKAKINEQARYIEQLEKARDFWYQKYKDATGAPAPTPDRQ